MRLFAGAALALSAGLFAHMAWGHITFPGFTEPMEGDVLQHIERIGRGLPAYPLPGAGFVALALMPLYYFIAAPLHLFLGVDSPAAPRLVSSVFALLSGIMVGAIAWREGRSGWAAALAVAFFFSSYGVMDACLTSGLPDSTMLFWVLLGTIFWAYGWNRWHGLAWIACFSLAFWSKQQGALYMALAAAYELVYRRGALPRWAVAALCLLGVPVSYALIGPILGDGFFLHTLVVPGHWERGLSFTFRRTVFVVACLVPFATLLALIWVSHANRADGRRPRPLVWMMVGSLFTAALTMTVAGSSNNHYVPFIALLGIGAALGAREMVEADWPRRLGRRLAVMVLALSAVMYLSVREGGHHPIPFWAPWVAVGASAIYLAVKLAGVKMPARAVISAIVLALAQFAISWYDPRAFLPGPDFARQQADLRLELASLPAGRVIWADYGNVPASLTGIKLAQAPSWVALEDLERQQASGARVASELRPFRERVRNEEDLRVLSNGPLEEMPGWQILSRNFQLERDYGPRFAQVRQVVGHWFGGQTYPRYLYRRRTAPGRTPGQGTKPRLIHFSVITSATPSP